MAPAALAAQQQPAQGHMQHSVDIKMEPIKMETCGGSGALLSDHSSLPPELALLNDPDFGGGGVGLQPPMPGADALLGVVDNSELAAAFNEMYNGPSSTNLMVEGEGDGGLGLGDQKDDDLFNFFS